MFTEDGLITRDDFVKIIKHCNIVGHSIYPTCSGGCIIDGVDFVPLFIEDPDDFIDSIEFLYNLFINTKGK